MCKHKFSSTGLGSDLLARGNEVAQGRGGGSPWSMLPLLVRLLELVLHRSGWTDGRPKEADSLVSGWWIGGSNIFTALLGGVSRPKLRRKNETIIKNAKSDSAEVENYVVIPEKNSECLLSPSSFLFYFHSNVYKIPPEPFLKSKTRANFEEIISTWPSWFGVSLAGIRRDIPEVAPQKRTW